ncbi:ANTAR domain-containing protein [Streptomyces sp. NPDC127036]|uniref:ANTAR domain-containing protein n=1 Tax=Streptomyces sp. NPDC127036 TaxID=3347112 RepID=UPI00365D1A8B
MAPPLYPATVIQDARADSPEWHAAYSGRGKEEGPPRPGGESVHRKAAMSVHANGTKPAPPASFEQAARHVAELKDENAHLQQAVHAHAVIDQAIGVLLAAGGLTPDQGWNALREVSQRTNTKLRHVAERLIEWARLVGAVASTNVSRSSCAWACGIGR